MTYTTTEKLQTTIINAEVHQLKVNLPPPGETLRREGINHVPHCSIRPNLRMQMPFPQEIFQKLTKYLFFSCFPYPLTQFQSF